jgi:hypoxanthine phosphoribosyltransferase
VKKLFYTYEQLMTRIGLLHNSKIIHDKYDVIVTLARGGLVLAQHASYITGIRDIVVMNVKGYQGDSDTDIRVIADEHHAIASIKGKRVLLVDDIYDSGKTIETVKALLEPYAKSLNTLVIFAREDAPVDISLEVHEGHWIVFPWDVYSHENEEGK